MTLFYNGCCINDCAIMLVKQRILAHKHKTERKYSVDVRFYQSSSENCVLKSKNWSS
jgi:hypothetical protein